MSATGQEERLAWRNDAQPEPRRTTRARGLLVIVSAAVLSLILAVKRVLGVPITGSLALFACGVAIYLYFDHLPEHNDRFADQLDVAAGLHPSESPVRQYDAARQYARHFAANNAVLAVDPFCHLRPGRPLSPRRGRIMARR